MYYCFKHNAPCVSNAKVGEEISEERYKMLLDAIASRPEAPAGMYNRLRIDGTWEELALPPSPPKSEELTDFEALAIITGGADNA